MDTQHHPVTDKDAEVVGLLAFSALAVMTRLAKDGDQAPNIEAHVAHARMSAQAFSSFERLEAWAQRRDFNLLEAAGAFSGLYDDLDARTRPTTWVERLIKTYVTVGIISDLLQRICQERDLFDSESAPWDLQQGAWVREHLTAEIEADEQLSARLSLWARRVAGEVFGLARATLFTHPLLVDTPEVADDIATWLATRHGERMASIHLKG